jgi:hypothetical protein
VPLKIQDSAEGVIAAVANSSGDLGLIGLGKAKSAWWEALGKPGQPVVMARLPFLIYAGRPAATPAVVIAKPLGDAAVDEIALVAADFAMAPQEGMFDVLAQTMTDRWRGLVAVPSASLPDGAPRLGSYARPIDLMETAGAVAASR